MDRASRQSARNKILNSIICLVIDKDASNAEKLEISKALRDQSFIEELASVCEKISALSKSEPYESKFFNDGRRTQKRAEEIFTIISEIRRNKLSKSEVTRIMLDTSEDFKSTFSSDHQTISEMIDIFLESATKRDVESFMNKIKVKNTADPFLKGIISRKEEK